MKACCATSSANQKSRRTAYAQAKARSWKRVTISRNDSCFSEGDDSAEVASRISIRISFALSSIHSEPLLNKSQTVGETLPRVSQFLNLGSVRTVTRGSDSS